METLKTLLVFTEFPNAYAPRRICEESNKVGISATIVRYVDVDFVLEAQTGVSVAYLGKPLPHADYVIFRSVGSGGAFNAKLGFLRELFHNQNTKILNNETYSKWLYFDKFTQHFVFEKSTIPYVKSHFLGDARVLRSSKVIDYPFIAKHFVGSHGSGVHKIESDSDLKQLFAIHPHDSLIIQPFLHSGADVRVIVIGGRAIGAMKRIAAKGAYLTNYSAGGLVENFDLDSYPVVRQLAQMTSKVFDCDYAGIDIIQDDNGKWCVLEVNRACQFEGFEKATGVNIASEIIAFLTN